MRCTGCDNVIPDGIKFCPICGARQAQASAPAEIPQSPPPQYPQYPQYQQYSQNQQYYSAPAVKESPCHVGFGEAIALYFKNYVNFKGRSTRSEYWYAYLFTMLIYAACYVAGMVIPGISAIASMVFLLPTMAIQFRRFHDTGRNGIMAIVLHVVTTIWSTFAVIMFFYMFLGAFGAISDYTETKMMMMFLGTLVSGIFPLALTIYSIVIFCQPSVPEENKYGRAPY